VRPDDLAAALSRARPLGDNGRSSAGHVSLDQSALANLRELGGDEFLSDMIGTFFADAPSLMASLRAALERGDAAEVRRAAHTLKSNGQTFGGGSFSQVCRQLEERAKRGELDGVGELADRIDGEYAALAEALAPLRLEPAS
jgi:HPt (histidine-containing phosphotransfer) domain-containing protein